MTVAAIMSQKVFTTTADAELAVLRQVFAQAMYQHVPVIDSTNRVIGIVSVKDYFRILSPVMDSASDTTVELFMQNRRVRQIMVSPVITVTEDTGIRAAATLLVKHNIGCLPVVDAQKRLLGIVSWKDIVKAALVRTEKTAPG